MDLRVSRSKMNFNLNFFSTLVLWISEYVTDQIPSPLLVWMWKLSLQTSSPFFTLLPLSLPPSFDYLAPSAAAPLLLLLPTFMSPRGSGNKAALGCKKKVLFSHTEHRQGKDTRRPRPWCVNYSIKGTSIDINVNALREQSLRAKCDTRDVFGCVWDWERKPFILICFGLNWHYILKLSLSCWESLCVSLCFLSNEETTQF